ncbi:MAG TPA: histidine kinase [Pseudonocardiaceae bacterium]|nr:histidine kinase [Pseudonocardiaceae bacterium]
MDEADRRTQVSPAAVLDIGLGALVFGVLAAAITADLGSAGPVPDAAYLFAVGFGALMLVRRRWPIGTLLVTTAGLLVYYALEYPPVGLAVPVAAALYSAAEAGRLRWAVGTAAGLVVVSTFFRIREGDDIAYLLGYELAVTATLMAAVIALGDSVRSRRGWQVELRRQARVAELEREQEAARRVEQERLRIARDLHDVLAHTISIVSLHSDVAREALRVDPDAAQNALHAVRAATNDASRELRATLELLREPGAGASREPPAGLDGLDDLVRSAAEGGLTVRVHTTGEPFALPAVVEAAAHRVVQESITNVLRHAGARTATVELRYAGDALTVRVTDDGSGCAGSPRAGSTGPGGSGGYGIAGMRERVALLGGVLRAGRRPEGGFVVEASFPLPVRT